MINGLEEFYKKIQNPILDESNFDTFVNAYAKHNFLDSQYKGNIGNVYSKGSEFYSPDDFNTFYAKIFNYWKNHLATTEISNTSSLYSLQQYFKNVKNVTTWEEAIAAIPPKRKGKYLNRLFDISQDSHQISSVDIHEQDGDTKHLPFDVKHILYVNVDLNHLHKLATKFLDKCEERKLPYLFDMQTGFRCDKSFSISSDTEHLLDYYQILQEIIKEDDDLKNYIYHPPVFSGVVDGWIGYESAEVAKNKDNEKFSHFILSKGFKRMVTDQPELVLMNKDGDKVELIDFACFDVIDNQIAYLSKLDRKLLKEYYNLSPRDLKNKKFLNSIFSSVKNEMLKGIQNKDFKFNDVIIDFKKSKFELFSKNKIHESKFTISHQDLEHSLSKTLYNIVDTYPKTKSLLQKGILKMAKKKDLDTTSFCMTNKDKLLFYKLFDRKKNKKKEERKIFKEPSIETKVQDFSNPLDTSNIKLLEDKTKVNNPHVYHLVKEEIIQDFPISSKQSSRFDGIMSTDDIRQSRIKLGFISSDIKSTTYSLKEEQIIQDLPINSKQKSRYQGIMTEAEIEFSREKIKTYCKK